MQETHFSQNKVMFTGWFIICLPVLIIVGALFFVSYLDWFSLHLVTLFLWASDFLIRLFVIILNSNKENSLTIMIIKSINITYLLFKPIIQNEP
jgi:hypothetical protein